MSQICSIQIPTLPLAFYNFGQLSKPLHLRFLGLPLPTYHEKQTISLCGVRHSVGEFSNVHVMDAHVDGEVVQTEQTQGGKQKYQFPSPGPFGASEVSVSSDTSFQVN